VSADNLYIGPQNLKSHPVLNIHSRITNFCLQLTRFVHEYHHDQFASKQLQLVEDIPLCLKYINKDKTKCVLRLTQLHAYFIIILFLGTA